MKKILFIVLCFTCMLIGVQCSKTNKIQQDTEEAITESHIIESTEEIEEKEVIPSRVVVIDPGHGVGGNSEKELTSPDSNVMKIKDPGGAQGVYTKIPEYKITLQVAEKLRALLESNGVTVIMTKTTEEEVPGNIERANIGNDNNADLAIRLHCDSCDSGSVTGASMLVPAKVGYATEISDISKSYGQTILDKLVINAGMKSRGVIERDDLTGFNWSKVPVVLVEMGFLSNEEEDKLLNTESYQNAIAEGLCEGIVAAIGDK